MRLVWEIYDEQLGLVNAVEARRLDVSLGEWDVSEDWMAWSVGSALVGVLRGSVRSGWVVQKSVARAYCADPGDGARVDL